MKRGAIRDLLLWIGLLAGFFTESRVILEDPGVDPVYKPLAVIVCNLLWLTCAWMLRNQDAPKLLAVQKWSGIVTSLVWLILGGMLLFFWHDLAQKHPIDPYISDILPSIKVYVNRFLTGEKVYAYFPMADWGYYPTYLPAMWLPYVPAELMGLDYRVWSIGFFWAAVGLWSYKNTCQGRGYWTIIALLMLFTMLYLTLTQQTGAVAHTVEWTPAAFYLLFALNFSAKKPWILGIAVLGCVLGRYSIAPWLPFGLYMFWRINGFDFTLKAAGWAAISAILIFVVGFLQLDLQPFLKGLDSYGKSIEGQWSMVSGANPPYHLEHGCGFAYWFWQFTDWPVDQKISTIKSLMLGMPALVSLLFAWRFRPTDHPMLYLTISLKAALVAFCIFAAVPWIYLHFLPLGVGFAVLLRLFSEKSS
jgi:hypothetical protein